MLRLGAILRLTVSVCGQRLFRLGMDSQHFDRNTSWFCVDRLEQKIPDRLRPAAPDLPVLHSR